MLKIDLRRELDPPKFSKKPENVAFRSISRMQSGPHSGSLPEGRSKHWPCRQPTQRPAWSAGDQAWFNSGIFASDKSGMAGVELAPASEPPAPASDLGASPFGRRPQAPLSCDLRLNHARFWLGELRESQHFSTFYGPSVQSMDIRLGARQGRRAPTVHRGRARRTISAGNFAEIPQFGGRHVGNAGRTAGSGDTRRASPAVTRDPICRE